MAINIISSESYKYKYDLAAAFSSQDVEYTAEKSGFFHILKIIEEELKEKNLLSSIFVEFNLVGTILSPDTPNKLNSLVYIRENESGFAENIKCFSNSIINHFIKKRNYTLFFHPDVFIDQENPQVCYSVINKQLEDTDIPFKNEIIKKNHDYYQKISNADNLFIGKATFDRDYFTLLNQASQIRDKGIDVEEELLEFHKLYHFFISNKCNTAYIAIPILGAQTSNRTLVPNINNIQGQGVVFIFLTIPPEKGNNVEEIMKDVTRNLFLKIGDFVRLVSYNYLFNLGLELQRKARREAIKSAKAAIMSRNMSHNLGSHVMAYLKQQLGSVTAILNKENKVLAELLPSEITINGEKVKIDEAVFASNDVELPFLVGLGRFIGYLQERQDYVATISTDYIPYGAPVNLKDAVYDELNPDLRYLRHKVDPHKNSENESDAKNKPANILLNYIAKSEGLSRENMKDDFSSQKDIRFGFISYTNEDEKGRTFGFTSFNSSDMVLSQMRKINISLPGGLVGRQAIFSIIENLIRNAAKHGETSQVENLDFTFDLIDGSDVSQGDCIAWENRVTDKNWRELYEHALDIEDIYILTITDNLPCKPEVAKLLHEGLYESFVDDTTGKMTTANKGIKEIRISSAWLRGEANEDVYLKYGETTRNALAPLVAVELSKNNNLRYMFCIRKNKTVAVVPSVVLNKGTDKEKSYNIDDKSLALFNELHKQDRDCWNIVSVEELLDQKISYSFILIPDSDEVFNSMRPHTSNRLLKWQYTDDVIASLNSSERALIYVYQLFTGLSEKSEDIFIDDGTASMENELREANEGKLHFNKIRFDASKIDFSKPNSVYLYKTHLSNAKDYKKFAKTDHYGSHECAEGITGDNSSDRLIRREWLDEKWYYTHLYALKRKIAIIDERIFKMVHSIDERLFVGYNDIVTIKELRAFIENGLASEKDILDKIRSNYNLLNLREQEQEQLLWASTFNDISKIISSIPFSIIQSLIDDKMVDKTVVGNNHLTPYYNGKGVCVFTVVLSADGEMMLVGCVDSSFNGNVFTNVFEKIATFKRGDNGKLVLMPIDKYKSLIRNRFDYISIHQGILDKIYENLDIKRNDSAKCELTACIHQCLMKDTTTIDDYLPRFIIHSGRAKPTVEDMPQKQPFVQYAAIENAVRDCKPMLVELLDYAKYEDN